LLRRHVFTMTDVDPAANEEHWSAADHYSADEAGSRVLRARGAEYEAGICA
jgi:hypothetical protein